MGPFVALLPRFHVEPRDVKSISQRASESALEFLNAYGRPWHSGAKALACG